MSKVFDLIQQEQKRQNNNIELIASENFVSDNILKAMGSCLTNKYAEGYPVIRESGNCGRYYGGCEFVNEVEEYCCDMWRKVFNTNYHVNVQPHSGSNANMAAYMAVLKPGDTILAMDLNEGGHLTHGSSVNFSGKLYNSIFYKLNDEGFIDYLDLKSKILKYRPNLILAGASAYSRIIDFKKIKDIIEECKIEIAFKNNYNQNFDVDGNATTPLIESYSPYFMVDMAHIAGLIAADLHISPFGYADIITTTTHKTLRGPRGGLIFCKPELAKKVDSAVFPGTQGGPLMHIIAAKAVCAEEALDPSYKEYMVQVVKNCAAMADEFVKLGYKVITGGTDNHLFLLDLTDTGYTGKEVQNILDEWHITLNKNCIPGETRKPQEASGVRIGTAAMTTKGYTEEDFRSVARVIDQALKVSRENKE